MNLLEYYDLLEKQDWFFHMSDDPEVYSKGKKSLETLLKVSLESDEHCSLYIEFRKHHFSGPAYGTEKHPKPEKLRLVK